MARTKTRRRRSSHRAKRRNTTSTRSASTALVPVRKTNPVRRRRHHVARRRGRRNPARRASVRRSNPGLFGIAIMPLLAGGISAALVQTVSNAIPFGAPGSLGELAKDGVLVYVVHRFWPKSFYPQAAVVGAAAIPIAAAVNTFLPGVSNTLSSTIRGFLPASILGGGTPAPTNAGMSGSRQRVAIY